jgi:hypothetical protein
MVRSADPPETAAPDAPPASRRPETRADQAAVRARALDRLRDLVWRTIGDRPAAVWLIGSMARGDWGKASDIDIAIDVAGDDHNRVRSRVAAAAEESSIPYRVDVIDRRAAGPGLAEKIIREGIEWPRPTSE